VQALGYLARVAEVTYRYDVDHGICAFDAERAAWLFEPLPNFDLAPRQPMLLGSNAGSGGLKFLGSGWSEPDGIWTVGRVVELRLAPFSDAAYLSARPVEDGCAESRDASRAAASSHRLRERPPCGGVAPRRHCPNADGRHPG
jgi:hypothetical protein